MSDNAAPAAEPLFDPAVASPETAVMVVIAKSVGLGASDLHLSSNPEGGVDVGIRHLGIVRPLATLPPELAKRSISHLKARAGLDIAERRRPQDGRWIQMVDGKAVDLRIATVPTLHGEDVAIRLLVRNLERLKLDGLGLASSQLGQLRAMIRAGGGLVLVSGPTGSGKTATLYASLLELADGTRKINTIEDPVEYVLPGLHQSQANPAIGVGYPELLRGLLRQNPDVIMIGEIRDADTARTAVHAANSGILVFATLHAPDAASALQTMRNLGAMPHFLGGSLRGVVAQRLVRTLCPSCRQPLDVSGNPGVFDEVRPWLKSHEGHALWMASGCKACGGTGYAGMAGVFEVMVADPQLRAMVVDGRPTRDIRTQAAKAGMLTFRQAGLLKVAHGETTTEELFRVIPSESLMMEDAVPGV